MIVLSVDPDDVPGMTVFDPFFRIVPADGDNTPYTKGITEDLYGFGDSLADTDTMAQRPDDLVRIFSQMKSWTYFSLSHSENFMAVRTSLSTRAPRAF